MAQMSTISKELFEELKQRTVNCVNDPNDLTIDALRQFVTKCDKHFINSLYQYSIFPLRLIISNLPKKQNNCEKTIESSVECLSLILQKSQINRFDIFADILANLLHLIDDNSFTIDTEFLLKPSEDLILSVIKCTKTLIENCDDCILGQVVSPAFSAQLGHSIHILLSAANKQKYSLIKAEAIETIDCLVCKCRLAKSTNDSSKSYSPQDLIAYFLPGISINISQLISSDDKLNRRVIQSSLTLLSNIIVFAFKSLSHESDIECKKIDTKQITNTTPEECEKNGFHVNRDNKWSENTCDKLNIVFEKIISQLISHQNCNVRQALQWFVTQILTNCCPQFIQRCLPSLIRVPLTYLSDDFDQISHESDAFLTKLSNTYVTSDSSKSYLDLIEDQIYSYITRLPRIIRTCGQREKETSIYLLYGYIKCLDTNGINYMLYSPQHKRKLFDCFVDICHFDYIGIRLLEIVTHSDKTIHLSDDQLPHKWVKKDFTYLCDDKLVTALSKCCQLVAERAESQVLIDYLVEALSESRMSPSVVFVSNQLLSHLNAYHKDIEEVLDLYLTSITTSLGDKTVESMNKDILRQCLLIEGLTAFLHIYSSDSSHNYLLKCIFPLLESVGAGNLCVYQTSHRALTLVAKHFDYKSISKLVVENMDYLVNSICINLKHFLDNQMVPIVIKVMLKFCTQDSLHLFVDIIDEIIVVIDTYHRSQSLPLMQVLYAFVLTLNHYFAPNVDNNQVIECNPKAIQQKSAQNFIKLFEDFVENRNISQNFDNELSGDNEEPEECDDNDTDMSGTEKTKEVPFFVPLVEKICERCVHIMSNIDPKVRLIVLDIVVECLRILKSFEDNLLPMAHKLWSPLVDRFTDRDVIVTKRSFACLRVMSEICGDFIRSRTLKEVMPRILSFLRSQSLTSLKKDKASAYRFTIAYQFQIDILCGIGSIAVNLDLSDKDLWPLIVDIITYLHCHQPLPLQESAMDALKHICKLDSNSVFYYLKMTYTSDTVITQENKSFPDIKFTGNRQDDLIEC